MQLAQATHTHLSYIHIAFGAILYTLAGSHGETGVLRLAFVSERTGRSGSQQERFPSFAPKIVCANLHLECFSARRLNATFAGEARLRAACFLVTRTHHQNKQLPARPDSHTTVRTPHPIPKPDASARPASGHRFLVLDS